MLTINKKKVVRFCLLTICFIIFLIMLTPAKIIIWQIKIPSYVIYDDITGTLWNGKIDNLSLFGQNLDGASWEFKLNGMSPYYSITVQASPDLNVHTDVFFKNGQPQFKNTQVNGNLKEIHQRSVQFLTENAALFPKNNKTFNQFANLNLDVKGNVKLNITQFSAQFAECISLDGYLELQNFTVALGKTSLDLGKITTPLSCNNNQLILHTKQISDVLSSDLSVHLGIKKGDYEVLGNIEPKNEFPNILSLLLKNLPRDGNLINIDLKGKL